MLWKCSALSKLRAVRKTEPEWNLKVKGLALQCISSFFLLLLFLLQISLFHLGSRTGPKHDLLQWFCESKQKKRTRNAVCYTARLFLGFLKMKNCLKLFSICSKMKIKTVLIQSSAHYAIVVAICSDKRQPSLVIQFVSYMIYQVHSIMMNLTYYVISINQILWKCKFFPQVFSLCDWLSKILRLVTFSPHIWQNRGVRPSVCQLGRGCIAVSCVASRQWRLCQARWWKAEIVFCHGRADSFQMACSVHVWISLFGVDGALAPTWSFQTQKAALACGGKGKKKERMKESKDCWL